MQQQEAFICFSLYSFTLIMNNWKKKIYHNMERATIFYIK